MRSHSSRLKTSAQDNQPMRDVRELFAGDDAVAIATYVLEETGRAVETGDFDLFQNYFALPHIIETYAGRKTLATMDDLRDTFNNSRTTVLNYNATQRIRRVLSSEFRNSTTIVTAHETRLVHKHTQVRDAYPAYGTLEWIDGVWKSTYSSYAMEDNTHPHDCLLERKPHMIQVD